MNVDNPYETPQHDDAPRVAGSAASRMLRPDTKDRTVGLVLFGVLEMLIGGGFALMIPLIAVSLMVPGAGAGNAPSMIPALAIYALMATAFVWLGVGSILARRWARALMLVFSWMWLVCGAFGVIAATFFMSGMMSTMTQQGQVPPEAIVMIYVFTGVAMGCMYVILPGALVLFYRSKHVKATCELRNPQPSWTDRCPLPVLAVSLMLGFSAFSMLTSPAYHCVFPLFGVLLKGVAGGLVFAVFAGVTGYLAYGTYRLKRHAWWGTLGLYAVWTLSAVVTFSRVGMMEFYRQMDLPEEQLKMMEQMAGAMGLMMTWGMALFALVFLGYMLYVRKYFFDGTVIEKDAS